ncbi:polysaccharide deacetylase family protein [Paenibacillus elgii]|uniref:polysaccharide deacetylase family protein n=1 Tax=Paenibacillus elgii TaxID=189691 RepID=UPI000FD916CC|nr:polysaccharide deacetylase family protein [Paenibacillus elgii]NEN86090.1 polysaccharide deacetylase family protein [Paenibacillus elgii]
MRLSFQWIGTIFLVIMFTCAFINDGLKSSKGTHFSNEVAVLEYHHIDPEASAYTITPEAFKQHLLALKANHYNVISMEDFIEFLEGRRSLPSDAVVLTFDDGYESFYKYAYPILKEQNMVATNFIIVNYLGTDPGTPFLNWNEIQEMKNDGFSFYSHTYNAHDFAADLNGKPVDPLTNPIYLQNRNRMETEEEYEQRVKADLVQADQIIESKLGAHDKLFCLPHGRYNEKLLELGNTVGIQYFFTGMDGLNAPGTKLVKRINAGSADVTPGKLLHKLNDETTLIGRLKITLKNYLTSQRMSE